MKREIRDVKLINCYLCGLCVYIIYTHLRTRETTQYLSLQRFPSVFWAPSM